MSDLVSISGQNESINSTVSFNTFRTYSYINNSVFYPLVKKEYYDYYNRFVRYYFYWYDGFVPEFHTQASGIFSTRLAYTLCNKLASLINGGNLLFDNPEELSELRLKFDKNDKDGSNALEFIEKWAYANNLDNKNHTAISYSLAGGDSVYKLNSDGKDLYPSVLRKDNYLIDYDFKGDIFGFEGLVYTYTKMTRGEDEGKMEDYYYLLEERTFDDNGKPQYRIYVKVGYGNHTNMKDVNFDKIQEVKWEQLPRDVKKAIKRNYGSKVTVDKWYDLPFEDSLGIYAMKASDSVSFLPQVPFGESILSNLISYLYSYDYYYSSLNTDMYIARGRILIPEPMQSPKANDNSGAYNTGLDSGLYVKLKYADPSQQKPEAIQFDNRAEQWIKTRNNLLQSIAMNLNISERTLANFLTDGSERATAREISVDDATATFVEGKRTLYRKSLNEMIADVLKFYEFTDDIKVRFSRIGLNNINEVVTQNTTMIQNGLTDIETALRAIHVDKNDRQLKEMAENIKQQQMEKQQQAQQDVVGTSDEGYEQQNNTDINHTEKSE